MSVLDIEKELNLILKKYNLDLSKNYYIETIKLLISERIKGKHTVIRGGGDYTKQLLNDFYDVLNPKYIIDANKQLTSLRIEKNSKELPVYNLTYLNSDIEVVVIGSYELREELKQGIDVNNIEILDLHVLLASHGLRFNTAYYVWSKNPYVASILLKNLYESSQNEYYLRDLIYTSLCSRDFLMTKKWIEEYIAQRFDEWIKFESLQNDIDCLLNRIKDKMQKRHTKDIVWFWQDGLHYEWVEYMPFTHGCRDKGLDLEHTYSSSVWTRCVYSLIFDKAHEIDDCSYKKKGQKRHMLTDYLQSMGYECFRIGDEKNIETQDLTEFDFRDKKLITFDTSTAMLNWQALRKILLSRNPVFVLIHSVLEAHMPACSPNLDYFDSGLATFEPHLAFEKSRALEKVVKITCGYLDSQNEFIASFLSNNTIKIFMSDHGSIMTNKSRRWTKDANHFYLIPVGGNIPRRKDKRLFSLYNFYELIQYLIEEDEGLYDNIFDECIKLQSVDVYNQAIITHFLEEGFGEYLVSFRGAVTEEDRFILLKNGKEIYNRFPDEYTNYIESPQYQERIQYLKEIAGDFFIEDYEDSRFDNVDLIYRYLEHTSE